MLGLSLQINPPEGGEASPLILVVGEAGYESQVGDMNPLRENSPEGGEASPLILVVGEAGNEGQVGDMNPLREN